jgi:hypothetical protein
MDISIALSAASGTRYSLGQIAPQSNREYIMSLLKASGEMGASARDLSSLTGMHIESVRSNLNRAVADGESHILRWDAGKARDKSRFAVYAFGPGKNAVCPAGTIDGAAARILKALALPMTAGEVASMVGVVRNSALYHVNKLRAASLIHISGWQSDTSSVYDCVAIYKAGEGVDAEKPVSRRVALFAEVRPTQSRMVAKLRAARVAKGSPLSSLASMAVQLGASA